MNPYLSRGIGSDEGMSSPEWIYTCVTQASGALHLAFCSSAPSACRVTADYSQAGVSAGMDI
jgi:hypothetical protein